MSFTPFLLKLFRLSRFWWENPNHEGSQRYTKDFFGAFFLRDPLSPLGSKMGFPLKTVDPLFHAARVRERAAKQHL
jgi:hypothetical protein